ncbi:hypothetical protein ACFRFQ_07800 [Rhodococcus sp. NPDC056743]|uniref:hypothetical protein n=1 Tax=Rhodococcus sp. NPDC056743 TaxID=3345934 RepID=UPI00366C1E2E
MGRRIGRVATALSIGTLVLTGCVSNTDDPTTFTAVVTVVGDATRVDPDSGQCIVGTIPVAPNDTVFLHGESGAASTRSVLEVDSVERNPDGTGVCTYVARFDAIPANQRNYTLTVSSAEPYAGSFASLDLTSDELQKGATIHLSASTP